ncbi:hypothetical protein C8J56DRAFT_1161150 [Mycena floridula]|nr:hypothetical protein C8J56DRAFT_1161150 [Mycena floridula]
MTQDGLRPRSLPLASCDSLVLSTRASSFSPARSSVFPLVLPYLRRLDVADTISHQKLPILTLKLSSPSYLDSLVFDDLHHHPFYTISTKGTTTLIERADRWQGKTKAAEIQWPHLPTRGKGKDSEGVLVQMKGGRLRSGAEFLRSGTLSSTPRKFNIPGYSKPLKWKQVGNSYWCVTASLKGPIATLDPALESVPPRLKIFETLYDKHDPQPLLVHHGVSILLLDHLLLSSLLLVTDIQEWMVVKKYEEDASPIDALTLGVPQSAPATSSFQWRKIMLGEPIFPRRQSGTISPASDMPPPTPTTPSQMAKILYREPIYPSLKNDSCTTVSEASDLEYSDDEELATSHQLSQPSPSRPPSPSAESVCYPLVNGSAPNHTYLDPMFYNDEQDVPPVPPLPSQYARNGRPGSSTGSTAGSTTSSGRTRELPRIPQGRSQDLPPRSRSTPPRDSPEAASPVVSNSESRRRLGRTQSVSYRRLPTPPVQSDGYHEIRPRPSTSKLRTIGLDKTLSQRSLPPTPGSAVPRLPQQYKDSMGDLQWSTSHFATSSSSEVIDLPPPAYTSINFSSNYEMRDSGCSAAPPTPDPFSL